LSPSLSRRASCVVCVRPTDRSFPLALLFLANASSSSRGASRLRLPLKPSQSVGLGVPRAAGHDDLVSVGWRRRDKWRLPLLRRSFRTGLRGPRRMLGWRRRRGWAPACGKREACSSKTGYSQHSSHTIKYNRDFPKTHASAEPYADRFDCFRASAALGFHRNRKHRCKPGQPNRRASFFFYGRWQLDLTVWLQSVLPASL
jgi:hypothetical protein